MEFDGRGERRNDAIGQFSSGMKRRLERAHAFLHRPHLLCLDEPPFGLVPQTCADIAESSGAARGTAK
jgi:ABC-type multidrug transport system ATPase subunit